MESQFAAGLLGGLCLVSVVMAVLARRGAARNPAPSQALSRLLFGVAVWMGLDLGITFSGVDVPLLPLLSGVKYFAIGVVISSFLVLCVSMAGSGWVPGRTGRSLLTVHPVVVAVLAATYPWHHLFTWLPPGGSSRYGDDWAFGPLFWLHIAWCYGVVAAGMLIIGFGTWQLPRGFRRQGLLVAVAPIGAVAANVVAILRVSTPLDGFQIDKTAVGLALGAPFLAYAVLRSDLVVMPSVARSLVVRRLPDALVTLSREGRVLDVNDPGRRLLRGLGMTGEVVGARVSARLRALADDPDQGPVELRVDGPDGPGDHEIHVHALRDDAGRELGSIVVARDVTSERRSENELHERMRVIEQLRAQLAFEADHDALTGLYNRRRLDQELEELEARGAEYALAIIDIDRFKAVNDRHGHAVGDAVLRQVAQVLLRHAGPEVVVGRWGGEEFVLVLSGEAAQRPTAAAEQVRSTAVQSPAVCDGATIPWTVSIGVAPAVPGARADHLLAAADDALYAAKRRGRNRVETSYRAAPSGDRHVASSPAVPRPAPSHDAPAFVSSGTETEARDGLTVPESHADASPPPSAR